MFRLEPADKQNERTQYRILHTKKTYGSPVKVINWDKERQSKPIDADPFCEGKTNHFLSHYNSLGISANAPYITTTMEMLNEINVAGKCHNKRKKAFINYTSYKDWLPCEVESEICPSRCVKNYLTSMQYFYKPPYPYKVERISCPVIPYLRNQKIGNEEPNLSKHKFYDEGFPKITQELLKHKSYRWKSYNPCTGTYSDGTPVPQEKKGCYQLQFIDENLRKKYLLKDLKCSYKLENN